MKRTILLIIFLLVYPVAVYYGIGYIKHIYEKIEKSPRTTAVKDIVEWEGFNISYYERWRVEERSDVLKISSTEDPKAYVLYAVKDPSLDLKQNPSPENLFLEVYEHFGVNYEVITLNRDLVSVPWQLEMYVVKVGLTDRFVARKMSFYLRDKVVLAYMQFPYQTSSHKKLSSELKNIHNSFRIHK